MQRAKLGIDTGGTYTDAVLIDDNGQVLAAAKSETTRDDLSLGIGRAVRKVLGEHPSLIELVGISTTLATNAIVEGRGGKAALVMAGFGQDAIGRHGLSQALRGDPAVFLTGGHNAHGEARHSLDLPTLDAFVSKLDTSVEAFAVTAAFAVRNPSHELEIAKRLRERTGLPVTMSHELTARLDGPKRALTTLFNARLIPEISRLLSAVECLLRELEIDAPVMVVRGDGSLLRADTVALRPVETILSGPAASVVGAAKLAGLGNALIADVGGTTTDIALLQDGRPKLDTAGARIGSYRTMVEALELRTTGLGGDSRLHHSSFGSPHLGPERSVPLSLLAVDNPAIMLALEAQLAREVSRPLDGQFAKLVRLPPDQLNKRQTALIDLLRSGPRTLEQLIEREHLEIPLNRFIERGIVAHCGFTPSDAAHVLGMQSTWNTDAAKLGARLEARKTWGGEPVALARQVMRLARQATGLAILEAACDACGEPSELLLACPTVHRAVDPETVEPSILNAVFRLDRSVVAVGGPARLFYPDVVGRLQAELVLPQHFDVANAIGAVSGEVSRSLALTVTQIAEERYVWQFGDERNEGSDAIAMADAAAERLKMELSRLFREAGGVEPALSVEREIKKADLPGGREMIVEVAVKATARGRPSLA